MIPLAHRSRRWRNVTAAGYLIFLGAGTLWTFSASGYLILVLAPVLLFDKCFGGALLEPSALQTRREIKIRLAYFLIAFVALWGLSGGAIALAESSLIAVAVSMTLFLIELLLQFGFHVGNRLVGRHPEGPVSLPVGIVGGLVVGTPLFVLQPLLGLHTPKVSAVQTPQAQNLEFEDILLKTSDGLKLTGWWVPAAAARGTAIFCHGHSGNRTHSLSFLPILNGLGLNVIAFDFRAHGSSGGGHTLTFGHREVLDVVAAHAYARERAPERPVFLIGISYGAAVTLQALPKLPDVRAVWVEGAMSHLVNVVEQQFASLPNPMRRPLVNICDWMCWIDCGFWGSEINPIECLREVRIPIYFVHGRDDDLIPFSNGEAVFEAYQGPKECFWVENADHFSLQAVATEEYISRLREFLTKHLGERT